MIKNVTNHILRVISRRRCLPGNLNIPFYIFCYHKVGTVLLSKVFQEICNVYGWKFCVLFGQVKKVPKDYDIVLFAHSLINIDLLSYPYRGLHLRRDPREIVISGYLYHLKTNEKWCVNSDLNWNIPIFFPKVPYSQEHRSEKWKLNYLISLKNRSYQKNLLGMGLKDGLIFEMNNYASWTIESMKKWDYNKPNILEMKFENFINDYDQTFKNIFEFMGLPPSKIEACLNKAKEYDLNRKSKEEIEKMVHVTSKGKMFKRWENYFDEEIKRYFKHKFGNICVQLGYEESNDW